MRRGLKGFINKLEAEKKVIAKRRDNLRELVSELETLADDCDTALEDLSEARWALDRAADVLSHTQ